ncbi:MAG: DUF1501 domain-containing protein [Isosphaeraceae bacterium]
MTRSNEVCGCHDLVSPRRTFLADLGMGFVGVALGDASPRRRDHAGLADVGSPPWLDSTAPRASRVIWLMMRGGVSHLESFDPKPALDRHAGKTMGETRTGRPSSSSPFPPECPRAGCQ